MSSTDSFEDPLKILLADSYLPAIGEYRHWEKYLRYPISYIGRFNPISIFKSILISDKSNIWTIRYQQFFFQWWSCSCSCCMNMNIDMDLDTDMATGLDTNLDNPGPDVDTDMGTNNKRTWTQTQTWTRVWVCRLGRWHEHRDLNNIHGVVI
jgi:hypothetical protein